MSLCEECGFPAIGIYLMYRANDKESRMTVQNACFGHSDGIVDNVLFDECVSVVASLTLAAMTKLQGSDWLAMSPVCWELFPRLFPSMSLCRLSLVSMNVTARSFAGRWREMCTGF